ncbi:uncharacterized protein EDB91DRAFT_1140223 [Suillus paluster]|uniref:uncharacterized protein n=1 Tax=Suillus paluster TaxID=48578 RepID=UPI001B87BE50|nr:uncharacterized protein EDB91DRAFT_1140223 [Suillus paluster]KAG1737503.1 hypothetical protein EDB91DRAFT_1140223 [Suillus paluster]
MNLSTVIQVLAAWSGKADELYVAAGRNNEDEIDLLALLDTPTDAHSWLDVHSWPTVRVTPVEDEAEADALLRTFTSYLRLHLARVQLGKVWVYNLLKYLCFDSFRNILRSMVQCTVPARPGDRTTVDALVSFCAVLSQGAAMGAKEGAETTKGMKARLGRASYVGDGEGGVGVLPDPGA